MKKLIFLLLLFPCMVHAREGWRDWCQMGNRNVVTSGINSTTKVQQSFPQCTITILVHGGGLATIYADNNNMPLANPFVSQTDGQFIWYADNGRYDQTTTSAGMPQPITMSDILLCDPADAANSCGTGTTGPHNLLSTTHLDTVPASPPTRGDIITAQNLTSPSGVTPAWARLPLGTATYVLTSDGTDAVWAPAAGGGTGCTLTGIDTGILSEHPAGTCFDNINATWDATNFNLQFVGGNGAASANTVGSNNTFMFGAGNNMSGTSWEYALGDFNDLRSGIASFSEVYAVGTSNTVRSTLGASSATVAIGFQNTIGSGSNANSGGENTFVLGLDNTIYGGRFITVLNYSNTVGTSGGAGFVQQGVVSGYLNQVNSASGAANLSLFGIYGDSNDIGGITNGNHSGSYLYGYTNHSEAADSFIYGLDNRTDGPNVGDIAIFGSSNFSTTTVAGTLGASDSTIVGFLNHQTSVGNGFTAGGANTMASCTACAQIGFNMTSAATNSVNIGISATPEVTITTSKIALPKTITIVATAQGSLGTPANGTFAYCNDCTIANPCAGGGSGALAKRLNGVWVCN